MSNLKKIPLALIGLIVSICLPAAEVGAQRPQANSCSLHGEFVGSAAVTAPGITQSLVAFTFVPPLECIEGEPGAVRIVSKIMGFSGGRTLPQRLEMFAPYLVDARGHLSIDAGGVVIDGEVGIGISDSGCPGCRRDARAFAFTAGPLSDVGFAGMAIKNLTDPDPAERAYATCEACHAQCPGVCFLGPNWCYCFLEHL